MKKIITSLAFGILFVLNAFSGNIISNGDFEVGTTFSTSYWSSTTTSPGVQTISIDNTAPISGVNSYKADVTTTGGYSTRLGITQNITFPKASTYTVSFKAKASVSCTMQSIIAQGFTPFGNLVTSPTFNVTTSVQTFSYDITTTTTSTGLCRLGLYYGNVPSATTLYIDDLTVVEKEPLTNRNLCNGDFETTMSNAIYTTGTYTYNGLTTGSGTPDVTHNQMYYGWALLKMPSSTADVTATVDASTPLSGTKSIQLYSAGTPTTTATDVMFCWQFGGQKDKYYTISFKAKASTDCSMIVSLYAPAWVSSASVFLTDQTCNLTTSVQTFTYTSTLPFLNSTDTRNLLTFKLGKVLNGVTISIDDVVIVEKETPTISWTQDLSALKTTDAPLLLTASSNRTSSTEPAANDISYASDNTDVVSVSGSTLTVVGVGTANVTASQPTNSYYYVAAPVIVPVTVSLDVPTSLSKSNETALFSVINHKIVINSVGSLQIFTIAGQSIVSKEVKAGDVIQLNSGIYLIRLISENGTSVRKIVL